MSKIVKSIIAVVALVAFLVGGFFLGRGLAPKGDVESTDVADTTMVEETDVTTDVEETTVVEETTIVEDTTVEVTTEETTEPEVTEPPVNYEAIIVELGDRLVEAHNELDVAKADYAALNEHYEALVEKLKEAYATIDEKENNYLNLKASIDSVLADIVAKNAEVETYKAKIAELEATIVELTTPVETTTETPVVVPEVTTTETPVVVEGE